MMTGDLLQLATRNGPRDVATSEGLADCKGVDMAQASEARREYMRQWRKENAERLREYQREYDRTRRDPEKHRARSLRYRNENLEVVREKDRIRARANPEAKAEYQRQYRADNAESLAEAKRQYYQENREALREYYQQWYSENSEKAKASARRRVVRKAGAEGSHTEAEWQILLSLYDGRCAYCGDPATSRDHVIPLSKGGRDDIDNIVPACHPCNSSKRARYLWEWFPRLKWSNDIGENDEFQLRQIQEFWRLFQVREHR